MPAVLRRYPLLCLLLAALGLRAIIAFGVQDYLDRAGRDFLIPGDAEGYWILAGKIASGQEYAVYDPPRRVLRMPGFPLLLSLAHLPDQPSFILARLLLAGVGTAGCAAVYLLGRVLNGPKTGLIAATLVAFWPVLAGFSVLVLSETSFAVLLTLSVTSMAYLVRLGPASSDGTLVSGHASLPWKAMWGALTGLTIVAACYIRPTWLPAVLIFPACYWMWSGRTREAGLVAVTVVAAAALTLAPWTVRNRVVTGHWVPTTLWVGPSLYDGLNPTATGSSDMRFFDEDQLLDRMSEYEMDREYRRRAWQFVLENPQRAAELCVVKLWRFWKPWPGAEQFDSPWAKLVVAAYYLPMLLLALTGAWHYRRDLWLVGLCAAPVLLFSLVHCAFVSSLRYRLPAEYPLCVLSALGVQRILSRSAPTVP